jgi:hypothetical protein
MVRIMIGFVFGFAVAKITDCTDSGKKIKSALLKCKDAVKEKFQEKNLNETP